MKTEMNLLVYVNMFNACLFSIGTRITRGACFSMAVIVYMLMAGALWADTHYVNAARPNDSGNGLSWATAEKTIQAAVTAASAGDTVLVTNGVYASISTANKSVTIKSVNGAALTVIDGGGTNRCATLGSAITHTSTILTGFTLRNGSVPTSYGGGSYYGTLSNCTLTANSASYGGGSYCGRLNNCTLSGNIASLYGGGSYDSTLNNCTLAGNDAANSGGGSVYGTLNNCMLTENNALYGGGFYDGTLNNCMLLGNRAGEGGAGRNGTLNNCTLSGNTAYNNGGGMCGGVLNNCILWGNTYVRGGANNYSAPATLSYSCTEPLPPGTGNISTDPLFRLPAVGDYRLLPGSPCLNTGTNGYAVGTLDWPGNPRIQNSTVDMGACEGAGTLATDPSFLARNLLATGGADGISVSWAPPQAGGAVLYRLFRMNMTTGQWSPVSDWITGLNFLDTQVFVGVTHRYVVVSAFDTRLDAISGLSASAEGQRTLIPQFYVDASRPSDAGDGRSWATAKKSIQAAIDISAPYDTILVTNGVYAAISTANKAITIQSVNGADVTIIDGDKTARCATLGSASTHLKTILIGFTLRNGSAANGGGSYYGTLNNCTLTGNMASSHGGGSYYGTLNNCMLMGNMASSNGGGSSAGTLNNCTLLGNSASYGGGGFSSTLNNCTLSRNCATEGGGSYYGLLNNCTLSDNIASSSCGGSFWGTLNNCIIWGNMLASGATDNHYNCTFNYSCTTPLPSGTGNLSADPLFRLPAIGDYRLLPGSPCLNAGSNSYAVGSLDGFGNPRIQDSIVDMGACEGAGTLVTDSTHLACNVMATGDTNGIVVSWSPPLSGGAVLYRVFRIDMSNEQATPISDWSTALIFLDTQLFGGASCRYAVVSSFDARFETISGLSEPAESQRILIPKIYVDASRSSDAGDGRSWATAKMTIQAAIAVSTSYDTILVTNGVYAPILTTNKLIAIRSFNGPAVTIIDGGGTNRCATLGISSAHTNTVLVGFTLRNGYNSSYGGGSYGGMLNNCMLSGNSAFYGGGAAYSALNNCTLSGNSASYGGGSNYGTLNNCTLSGNSASSYGGGACYGRLNNCTLLGNSASSSGGGSYNGTLNNCTLTGNSSFNGGGSYYGTLNNCMLIGNSGGNGGGSYNGGLNNCTFVGNRSSSYGGGSCDSTLNNCIVWGNTCDLGVAHNCSGGTFRYSNTSPLQSGTGNVSVDPLFQDTVNSNYLLRVGSPCINTGSDAFVVGTTDLLGNPRILGGRVDMGAYEMPPTVTVTFDANGGLLATGQSITNRVGFAGDSYDSWLTLSNGISRVGYTFTGWFTASTGGVLVYSNHAITVGRVYAQWMANSYALALDWQNGLDVTLTNVLYGQAYQLASAVFADAAFLGWWTLPNGVGMCMLPETLVSVASNHTLYAQWDINSVVGSTGLVWQTEGDSLWFVQTNAMTQGLSAMRSGVISDNQTSWIGTTVTGPGQFSFWWRVSSEGGYDELAFAVDGVHNRVISGIKKDEWQLVEVAFTNAGPHELRWTYSKDDSVSEGLDCGWLDRVAWIPARPIIPGNPNVSSNFLDTVTQAQIDALVAGLRAAHPDVTDGEIAKKFEDADLFGFTGAALVGVGADALVRFNPSITLSTLSVVEGDPKTLLVTVTIGNNIDPIPATALARLGEAINSRMRGVFKNSLSAGASEAILTPALSLDNATGIVTATFTLENPAAPSGFLRMSLRK